jgi:hypothetical protein
MNETEIGTCPMGYHIIQNIHNGKVANGTIKAGRQNKKAPGAYIRWDAEGVEVILVDEQEKVREVSVSSIALR